jgi:UDP-N-acetylglucosamine transferase subunit ALG13
LVQHGTSRRPSQGDAQAFLTQEEMREGMSAAAAVVTHAGPGTITLCRSLGKVPIVVPRDPALGEHVDDHQVLFARRLAAKGLVRLARSQDELAALLDLALQEGPETVTATEDGVQDAVRRFGELTDDLLLSPRVRWWRRRRTALSGRGARGR